MTTTYLAVPAGTSAAPVAVTPTVSCYAAPSVLGGSVTIEFSTSLVGPWFQISTGTSGASFRPTTNGYVRVTAVTNQANAFFSDFGQGNSGYIDNVVLAGAVCATPNSTSAVPLFSFRTPPNFLPPQWQMQITGTVSLSNNANVKTLNVYANGIAGTALATSPSIASALNFTFQTLIVGKGDGVTTQGTGVLASQTSAQGGFGISTTAAPTITRDYLTQETEYVIGITKATGTDTAQLETLSVRLYV